MQIYAQGERARSPRQRPLPECRRRDELLVNCVAG
jgi:hypothetical protein